MTPTKDEPITLHRDVSRCPECGCEDIKKLEGRQVSDDQWLEEIAFSCGYGARRSTRDDKTTCDADCRKSPSAVHWRARRAEMADAIISLLEQRYGAKPAAIYLLQRTLINDLDLYRDELDTPSEAT